MYNEGVVSDHSDFLDFSIGAEDASQIFFRCEFGEAPHIDLWITHLNK